MTIRRRPRWTELRPYLQARPTRWWALERRLTRAATIADLRRMARRRVPRSVFDYTDGAAENETGLRRARGAYQRVEFKPSVLRDVSRIDTSTTILGRRAAMPLVFAPTGFTRFMNHEGEPAVARVAARAGIPYALSTLGTTSPEALAEAVPHVERWFQLYVGRDRSQTRELIGRAEAAGYSALILTVDAPVAGQRLRDVHNGLTIPPALTAKTLLDMSIHPGWWFNLLTTEPLTFASLSGSEGTVADLMDRIFDPSLDFDDLTWLRGVWSRPLIVKGIQSVDDARAVVDRGADAIVISNHGGRQLDRAPTTLELLPSIVAEVGDRAEVYVDGGIMSGGDIVAAVAMGAQACLVGRAYLYGLMAGGEHGVQRATDILNQETRRTMQLLGTTEIAELTADKVRLRESRGP